MNTRKHYLATAAVLALAMSGTAFAAEVGPNGPQESTPAEKAQTQTLNSQQQNGSYVDPAVANGAATADQPVPAEGVAAAASQTSSADAQYQAQQQQYQDQQQQYAMDLNTYEHQRAAYEWQRRHPATWWRDRYTRARYITTYSIERPALMDVAVTDRGGYLLGHVEEIERLPSGHISRIRVRLAPARVAWIEGSAIRWFPDDHLLMVDLNAREIWQRSAPI
ncbi:MAG TPA: hypothetical protein VHL34_09240 [Rhizomicrobium sp.]|jgi:hypothetical protein|nr:hypothetical protein [Rhizomicrobium sp.]